MSSLQTPMQCLFPPTSRSPQGFILYFSNAALAPVRRMENIDTAMELRGHFLQPRIRAERMVADDDENYLVKKSEYGIIND